MWNITTVAIGQRAVKAICEARKIVRLRWMIGQYQIVQVGDAQCVQQCVNGRFQVVGAWSINEQFGANFDIWSFIFGHFRLQIVIVAEYLTGFRSNHWIAQSQLKTVVQLKWQNDRRLLIEFHLKSIAFTLDSMWRITIACLSLS